MKTVPLTRGLVAMVSDQDYARVSCYKWVAWKSEGRPEFYAVSNYYKPDGTRTRIRMHRIIMGVTNPKISVDHKDHNGLNNQRRNLRVTSTQNSHNYKKPSTNTSGYKGVSRHTWGWQAGIKLRGKRIYLGLFASKIKAAKAYDRAARRLFGRFALTNF